VCGQIDRGRFSRFSRVVLYFLSLLVPIRLGVVAFLSGFGSVFAPNLLRAVCGCDGFAYKCV
jgi:hypothetical protein